jgi:O-antigen ligase
MPAIAAFFLIVLPWLNPFSPGPTSAVGPLLFSWLCGALLLLALAAHRQQGKGTDMLRAVATGWLAAAAISAVIGLLQYFGETAAFGVWLNHTELGVAYGNLRQRNQFATLINIGLVALLWLAAREPATAPAEAAPLAPGLRAAQRLKNTFGDLHLSTLLLLAGLLGTANAASSSRTGLLQLVLVVALVLWWQWVAAPRQAGGAVHRSGTWRLVLLTVVLAYVAASFALPLLAGLDPLTSGAWARLRSGDALCSSRMTLWRNVLYLIAQKPWLGWGWGELDYAHFITLYPGLRFCDILDNAHNLPLQLAVELGVPLTLLLCGLGAWLVWRAQPWRASGSARQMAWGVLAVILLHSLLEYPLWYGPFQMAAALSVWLLWWLPKTGTTSINDKTFRPLARYLKALTAIFIIVICSFITWNYHLASQIYQSPDERDAAYQDNTLEKIRKVWFFADQVRFADLTTAELDATSAPRLHALALEMLHFSPETRVVERLLDSATLLGRIEDVAFYAARLQAAFPNDHALWLAQQPPAVNSK